MLPWQTWQTYVSSTNKYPNPERKNINTDYNNNLNNRGSGPWGVHYTFGCFLSNFNNSVVSKLDDSSVVSRSQRLWRCLGAMLLSRSLVTVSSCTSPKANGWGCKPTSQGTLLPTQRTTGNLFFSHCCQEVACLSISQYLIIVLTVVWKKKSTLTIALFT